MALDLVWTKRAVEGYERIVEYLIENFTDIEVENFINESSMFFDLLKDFPDILQRTAIHKNLHRGPLNKFTIVTYRVKPRKKQIELINIRGSRQKPVNQKPVTG